MHFGRNHRMALRIALSAIGGFATSFTAFVVTTYMQHSTSLQGQLLAGDPTQNKEFPTTLNTMHAVMDGQNSILGSMGTYGFWVAVTMGAVIAGFIIFKMMRRYV